MSGGRSQKKHTGVNLAWITGRKIGIIERRIVDPTKNKIGNLVKGGKNMITNLLGSDQNIDDDDDADLFLY